MPNLREKLMKIYSASIMEFHQNRGQVNHDEFIIDSMIANGVTVLPVKVGDTVYTNFAMRGWYFRDKDRPYSARVCFIGLNDSEEMGGGLFNVVYGKHENMMQFRFSDIGKSVFLTKEEAEQALKKMRMEETT